MFEPSKGGSSPGDLASLFMNNKATQATPVATITQPQRAPLPTFGSMAPMQQPQQQEAERAPMPPGFEQINSPAYEKVYGSNSLWQAPDGRMYDLENKRWTPAHWGMTGVDTPPPSQYEPDVRMWLAGLGGQPQAQQQQPQMSQAQQMARAMNDRFR